MLKKVSMITLVLVMISVTASMGEVPTLISYQGRLTNLAGLPVADANYSVEFRIYDGSGAEKWMEPHSVDTEDGVFSVLLGSNGAQVTADVFSEAERYLGIKVGTDPELSPRAQLVAVPYAMRTATVDQSTGGRIFGQVIVSRDDQTQPVYSIGLFAAHLGDNEIVAGLMGGAAHEGTVGDAIGVYGLAGGPMGEDKIGVRGEAYLTGPGDNYGIQGLASGNNGVYGVYGEANTGSPSYAGYFAGNVHITGLLTGGIPVSKFDHPDDPENMYLQLATVSSPELKNVYDGVAVLDAAGEAEVTLPGYCQRLNREFRYQLTCIGGYAPVYVADEVSGNRFRIAGGQAGMKVCWQVTGVQSDAHTLANPMQVELPKAEDDRGKYCHPEAFGLSKEFGIDYELRSHSEPEFDLATQE